MLQIAHSEATGIQTRVFFHILMTINASTEAEQNLQCQVKQELTNYYNWSSTITDSILLCLPSSILKVDWFIVGVHACLLEGLTQSWMCVAGSS